MYGHFDEETSTSKTKEGISSSYIEDCKQKYKTFRDLPSVKDAIIIGAEAGNIGQDIANKLHLSDVWGIRCYNKKTWRRELIAGNEQVLILCNATNHMDWVEDFPDEKALEVINDSFTESVLSAQAFVRKTMGTPYRKKIIFIGSMAYRNVLNASSVYCAAKAAIAHYSRCLAWELAPKGYDVFCVHPSNTLDTPMTEATIEGLMRYRSIDRAKAEGYWSAVLPREKFLTKEEISKIVINLLSDDSVYMAGSQIELGGGQR